MGALVKISCFFLCMVLLIGAIAYYIDNHGYGSVESTKEYTYTWQTDDTVRSLKPLQYAPVLGSVTLLGGVMVQSDEPGAFYPNGVERIIFRGKNIVDFTKAEPHLGKSTITVTEDGVIMHKDSVYFFKIPVDIPAGYDVVWSASAESGAGRYINKVEYIGESGTKYEVSRSKNSFKTPERIVYAHFCKHEQTKPLESDLFITDIQIEYGSVISPYSPYNDCLYSWEVPEEVRSLDGYGVGDEDVYNYIALKDKAFVRVCEYIDGTIIPLETSETVDISEYIPDELTNALLSGVGSVEFITTYGTPVPTIIKYKQKTLI